MAGDLRSCQLFSRSVNAREKRHWLIPCVCGFCSRENLLRFSFSFFFFLKFERQRRRKKEGKTKKGSKKDKTIDREEQKNIQLSFELCFKRMEYSTGNGNRKHAIQIDTSLCCRCVSRPFRDNTWKTIWNDARWLMRLKICKSEYAVNIRVAGDREE